MSDDIAFGISLPCDDDGFILLQCEYCGSFFKITAENVEDDQLLNIYCPSCGLVSADYLTEDVLALSQTMLQNFAMDLIYDAFKGLERETRNKSVQFKAGKKPKHENENPIKSGIEALDITNFECCMRTAKIKPLLKMTGCYCPFCGVKEYETK